MLKIKRALISVYDKTNIVEFAQTLKGVGCEIISTGGTAKELTNAGIDVIDIQKVTGNPEAFGGRMKTISFQIESALLFDREKDSQEAKKLGIIPIDLVVCNLYPFAKVKAENADLDVLIENIDIGGPTMIRAGAKNFKHVAVVTSPKDYAKIMEELSQNNGCISYDTRKNLMKDAFNHTADYDAMIASAMDKECGDESIRLSFNGGTKLRYGENSHQSAMYFKEKGYENSLYDMKVISGKELSFNNIIDINSAVESAQRLKDTGCAIIKHTNPCGLAEGQDQRKALELAWQGDPVSAFGSIIAFNKPVDHNTVKFFELDNKDKSKRKFIEVVIAPKFDAAAIEYLKNNKNLRIIEFNTGYGVTGSDIRYMNGSLLIQNKDAALYSKLETVTEKSMDIDHEKSLIDFGLSAISSIKSNSIVVVRYKDGYKQLLGMGAGQPNRVKSTHIALDKSCENLAKEYVGEKNKLDEYIRTELANAVLVSDAFFPFSDNVEVAGQYGIKKIVQPGGSIRDKDVIKTCNDRGIAMIFTGLRHFKH